MDNQALNLDDYDVISSEAVGVSKVLPEVYKQLGYPKSPMSSSGERMMEVLVSAWQDLYPVDARAWFEERKKYQETEMSISQQVSKQTGRSLASYPLPLYKMMKLFFPTFKFSDRKTVIKFVKKYPMFRFANTI